MPLHPTIHQSEVQLVLHRALGADSHAEDRNADYLHYNIENGNSRFRSSII